MKTMLTPDRGGLYRHQCKRISLLTSRLGRTHHGSSHRIPSDDLHAALAPREHVRSGAGRRISAGLLLERTVREAAARGGVVARCGAGGAHGRRRIDPVARAFPRDPPAAGVPPSPLEAHPRVRSDPRARLSAVLLLGHAADAG